MSAGEKGRCGSPLPAGLAWWRVWILELEPVAPITPLFLGIALRTIVEKIPQPTETETRIDRPGASLPRDAGSLSGGDCLQFPYLEGMWSAAASRGPSPLDWGSQQDVVLTRILLFHFCIMKEPLDLLRSGSSSCIFKFLVPSNPSHSSNGPRTVSYLPRTGVGSFCWPIT